MKKNYVVTIIAVILSIGLSFFIAKNIYRSTELSTLPKPELSEGQRGELGIDKNINESNIDSYLGRSDSVYYDMRMLEDPASYENIGGDRFLSGFVNGFEVLPYPYLATVSGLPEAVGKGYQGDTLFSFDENGNPVANFEESLDILEDLFPKDKNIFLMCGGGGYAGMTKNLLTKLGWDPDKIYVVGGYWYYDGTNNVTVKYNDKDGGTSYAFWKVPYHNIDFSKLTRINHDQTA